MQSNYLVDIPRNMKADDFLKALYFANDLMKRIFIKVHQTEYYITSIRPGFKRNTERLLFKCSWNLINFKRHKSQLTNNPSFFVISR